MPKPPVTPVFEGVELSVVEKKPGSAELIVVANYDFLWHARAVIFLVSRFKYRLVYLPHGKKKIKVCPKDGIPELLKKRAIAEGKRLGASKRKPKQYCGKLSCVACKYLQCAYRVIL
jgi:hypothetical protein